MQFFVQGELPKGTKLEYPNVKLVQDNWDDYGYKTTFVATLNLRRNKKIEIGTVKVMRNDQGSGSTKMPKSPFKKLSRHYASLGSNLDYYENLYTQRIEIYKPYLDGLRDVAFNDGIKARFEDLEAFRVSLLRFSGSERTVADAAKLFSPRTPRKRSNRGFTVSFKTSLAQEASPLLITFDFRRRKNLPTRVNAVIGYNGTGKTRLLSNMAVVASGYGYKTKDEIIQRSVGRYVRTPPRFKTVIVVSYSAFDTFEIPGRTKEEAHRIENEGGVFGYVYCGLRKRVDKGQGNVPAYQLRTPEELEEEFLISVDRIRLAERLDSLLEILRPLLQDPSFLKIGLTQMFVNKAPNDVRETFKMLSSGHKAVLKIIVDITANIDGAEPSLILMDEPETHLHPPLLAAFLKSFRVCLDEFNGYAVIATHSPVVLQETPSRFVHVLRRVYDENGVTQTSVETFAENIGVITQDIFHLEDGSTDWHSTLLRLARDNSLVEIEKMFGRRLGFAARSYLHSFNAEHN